MERKLFENLIREYLFNASFHSNVVKPPISIEIYHNLIQWLPLTQGWNAHHKGVDLQINRVE